MKYIKVGWPEIQEYMDNLSYSEESYFDPSKNCWFIPEDWLEWEENSEEFFGGDIGDLEDAMG